jgi:uncharacterized protein (TIGR03067 family)
MLSRRAWMGLALAALIVPAASLRGADDKIDGDLKAIQGKWSAKMENGNKVTFTIEDRKLKMVAPSRTYEFTMTLDPEAKPNKTLDLLIVEAPEDAKGKTSKAIYKLEGDQFTFCFAPEGDRPTKFETEGYEKIVMTLTKDKD